MSVVEIAKKAKKATSNSLKFTKENRVEALNKLAKILEQETPKIIEENKKDLEKAQELDLSSALVDRLTLNPERIKGMIDGVLEISLQEDILGKIIEERRNPQGLIIQKQRIPLGLLGMIFESRPNVVIDCGALAIKSGNAMILKGGKEAFHSNKVLASLLKSSLEGILDPEMIQLIDTREDVKELLELNEYVDVVIPRGGEGLVRYVLENAKMPVIAHYKGLCHVYVHEDAKLEDAKQIAINSKCQRPGVCNAMETLILNKNLPKDFINDLLEEMKSQGIQLNGQEDLKDLYPSINIIEDEGYHKEYLDKCLSVKLVNKLEEAIGHINTYGSNHTESICSQNPEAIEKFLNEVDASCLAVNASTRFNDGGQLGLGAELGISTSKLHSYGPMGVKEMTTTRYLIRGEGHIRQ